MKRDLVLGTLAAMLALACVAHRAEAEVVGIANPGFENGREAWTFDGANAVVVGDVAHTGSRSARIEVRNALKDGLYVKRYIPIEGGGCYSAECFVKTEEVRKDKCELGSVGAGLIVEWLDADRKWIGTGEYACGLWGTADWRKVECKSLKAPAEAGYAVVFLALRGAGRAWFDDVTFCREAVSVEKLEPVPDAKMACNTPLFRWKESHGARSYSVALSRTREFSRDVRTWPTEGLTSFRLTERLAPGTWYWKVTAPGRDDSAPWRFVQTASGDKDCLPPEVLTPGARVLSANDQFEVVVRDDRFMGVSVVFEGQAAADAGASGKGLRRFVFKPPAQGWPTGLTIGTVETRDSSGNSASRIFYLLNAKRPDNFVKVDGDGFYTVGGKRAFPLSIYEVTPAHFGEVRSAGFDNVHLYSWEGNQDDAACRAYLDGCWAAGGLRAFIGFDRGRGQHGNGLIQGNYGHVAKRVGALADHPGLFCWYLYDEPELLDQFASPALLKSHAELIRALDPYHPVVMSTWNNAMVGIRDYRPVWDVHWTQAYGRPDNMLGIIESQRSRLVDPSPMTLILGCNDGELAEVRKRGGTPDPDAFFRDYDLFRASAYLGVVQGFNGLSWWWYGKDRSDFYSAAHSPKGWRDLVKVVDEIRVLRPLILSEERPERGKTMVGKAAVVWWTKKYRGKRWLIAVNTSENTLDAKMEVPGFGKVGHSFGRYGVWTTSK